MRSHKLQFNSNQDPKAEKKVTNNSVRKESRSKIIGMKFNRANIKLDRNADDARGRIRRY